ncbi:MAG: hypothetical protein ACOH2M_28250 [Cypionkella sp.]
MNAHAPKASIYSYVNTKSPTVLPPKPDKPLIVPTMTMAEMARKENAAMRQQFGLTNKPSTVPVNYVKQTMDKNQLLQNRIDKITDVLSEGAGYTKTELSRSHGCGTFDAVSNALTIMEFNGLVETVRNGQRHEWLLLATREPHSASKPISGHTDTQDAQRPSGGAISGVL